MKPHGSVLLPRTQVQCKKSVSGKWVLGLALLVWAGFGSIICAEADSRWLVGAGIGFPQLVGARVGQSEFLDPWLPRWELNAGYVPLPMGSGRSVRIGTLEVASRWDLAEGPFFIAGGAGYRYAAISVDLSTYSFNDEKLVSDALLWFSSLYFAGRLGARLALGDHWELSTELGVQLPVAAFGGLALSKGVDGANLPDSVFGVNNANFLSRVARLVLPEWKIIQLTYLF